MNWFELDEHNNYILLRVNDVAAGGGGGGWWGGFEKPGVNELGG